MTHAENVNAKHKEVSQEVAGDQVKDDAQATVTAPPAIQKIEVPLQSSSISSDYATKFLNFDNIPSSETKIISMMDIKVQHEDPSIRTSPLLIVLVMVILETSTAPATTIPLAILPFIHLQQQSTPIPTPTTTEATTSSTDVPDSKTLSAINLKVLNLEKEVKELKNIDHSSALRATIKYEVLTAVKEYLGTSMDYALYKVLQRHTADLSKEHSIPADVVEKLKQQDKPQKSAKDIRKVKMEQAAKQQETKYTITSSDTAHRALYHALIESILEDKDAIDKGVADKSKKRKPDDADRDEGLPAGPDQRLKRKKTSKETEPSKKAKSTRTYKDTTKS
nr:hypothetical protein [Tanacetum cinerariifolium]